MERKKTSTTLEANRRCSVKLVFRLMANAKQKRESRPSALWPRYLVLLHSAMRILSNHGLGSVREWQKEAQRRAKEEEKEDEEEEERESEKQYSEARGDGDVLRPLLETRLLAPPIAFDAMPPAPLPLSRRPGSIVAALFFASHIPVTLLVDSQAGELEKEFPPVFSLWPVDFSSSSSQPRPDLYLPKKQTTVFPREWYPAPCRAALQWYLDTYKDPLVSHSTEEEKELRRDPPKKEKEKEKNLHKKNHPLFHLSLSLFRWPLSPSGSAPWSGPRSFSSCPFSSTL